MVVLEGLKTGEINPCGRCCGRFRGCTRRSTRGPTRGATHGPTRGSTFAFACSVGRPAKVPPYNGNDARTPLLVFFLKKKTLLLPPLLGTTNHIPLPRKTSAQKRDFKGGGVRIVRT